MLFGRSRVTIASVDTENRNSRGSRLWPAAINRLGRSVATFLSHLRFNKHSASTRRDRSFLNTSGYNLKTDRSACPSYTSNASACSEQCLVRWDANIEGSSEEGYNVSPTPPSEASLRAIRPEQSQPPCRETTYSSMTGHLFRQTDGSDGSDDISQSRFNRFKPSSRPRPIKTLTARTVGWVAQRPREYGCEEHAIHVSEDRGEISLSSRSALAVKYTTKRDRATTATAFRRSPPPSTVCSPWFRITASLPWRSSARLLHPMRSLSKIRGTSQHWCSVIKSCYPFKRNGHWGRFKTHRPEETSSAQSPSCRWLEEEADESPAAWATSTLQALNAILISGSQSREHQAMEDK
jgi:hypothetical protein